MTLKCEPFKSESVKLMLTGIDLPSPKIEVVEKDDGFDEFVGGREDV